MSTRLSNDSYKKVLVRLRDRIANGLELNAKDSTDSGNKYTECTWGLCSDEKQTWPDAKEHLWPDLFLKDGRVAPRYRTTEQLCPMDTREPGGDEFAMLQGCFYTCKVFSRGKNPLPTREQTIKFYDYRLTQAGSLV